MEQKRRNGMYRECYRRIVKRTKIVRMTNLKRGVVS